MRHILIFLFVCSLNAYVKGQSDSVYQALLAEAGFFHLQKDYKNAIISYEKAFESGRSDALTAYKAAAAYSLDSNAQKALSYLQVALKSGWTEADWLSNDPDFDYLRNSIHDEWEKVVQQAFLREKEYEESLNLPALRKRINLMALKDQMLRYQRIRARDNGQLKFINQQIHQRDSSNLVEAKNILKHYGWPKISEIGRDGQNNFWLIVQHADQDVLFQNAALTAIEKLKGTPEVNMEHYAFLYDRVQCNLNLKQLYGTQVNWTSNGRASGFRPIINEHLVDERRKKFGFSPLSVYALTYGFQYTNLTAVQAIQQDSIDLAYTTQLIDSANYFYAKGEFQKTYDFYNAASTVLGGMSNEDNFKAAILFANIASQRKEQQYKDIAIDFLNLLLQREVLTKIQLKRRPEFKVLYNEQRWADLYRQLK